MKKQFIVWFIPMLVIFLVSCLSSEELTPQETSEIRNVILMIGYGMGSSTVYLNGSGADKFNVIYDNTDIFKKIMSSFGFDQ